ncbi:N-acetyltransferase [Miniphocaeibacter massiliensis]|uniref:N-acetyltransferase n=1 Tax=Miniphocaeibacter massiliensis TaxID=2041841 RepID=UPI000C07C199|nr:N-acetyltransferase [Miniphocaeibacter massiliensis]
MIKEGISDSINEIMDIWLNSNIDAHSFIDKNYWKSNYEMVKEMLPRADIYTYIENNKIVGFIGIVDSEYIAGLFVYKSYRSKGIGKKLLDYCKNKYTNLELDVYEKNTGAVSFYKNNGVIVEKEQEDENLKEKEYHMKWSKTSKSNIKI